MPPDHHHDILQMRTSQQGSALAQGPHSQLGGSCEGVAGSGVRPTWGKIQILLQKLCGLNFLGFLFPHGLSYCEV